MPTLPRTKNLTGFLKYFFISAAAIGLMSCGDGSGGPNGGANAEPAPRTMNGIIFSPGGSVGPVLTMIRVAGDATKSGETGTVRMNASPGDITVTSASGVDSELRVSPVISGATYTYSRTSSVGGRLVVRGTGLLTIPGSGGEAPVEEPSEEDPPAPPEQYEYFGGEFSRTYDIIYATNGTVITTLAVTDYDTEAGIGAGTITFSGGTMRLVGGGLVPVGWSIETSSGLVLPKLYPLKLSTEDLYLTFDDEAVEGQSILLLTSTFTPLSPQLGDFVEKGVGNLRVGDSPTPVTIGYEYSPDADTTNQVELKILRSGSPSATYEMIFDEVETGTFIDNQGRTGTFEFPFLQN